MAVETKLATAKLAQATKRARAAGFKVYPCPAQITPREGLSGGTWILVQSQLGSHGHQLAQPQGVLEQVKGEQWSAAFLRLKGLDICCIAVYMAHSQGQGGVNAIRYQQIGIFIKSLKINYIIAGDWNCTPEQLEQSGWVRAIGATVAAPMWPSPATMVAEPSTLQWSPEPSILWSRSKLTWQGPGPLTWDSSSPWRSSSRSCK